VDVGEHEGPQVRLTPLLPGVTEEPVRTLRRTKGRTLARTIGRGLVALAAALLLAIGPGPTTPTALAACPSPMPIKESFLRADVVVVGTVTHLENFGRWITIRVEERWRAPESLSDTIAVRAGPGPGSATSVDRVYEQGRYLFFLTNGPEYFVDNACTATTLWTDDLAPLRPTGVVPAPTVVENQPPGAFDSLDLLPVAALIGALAIVLVSYLFILRARRRPPDWMR
jgi:hypothetical protein